MFRRRYPRVFRKSKHTQRFKKKNGAGKAKAIVRKNRFKSRSGRISSNTAAIRQLAKFAERRIAKCTYVYSVTNTGLVAPYSSIWMIRPDVWGQHPMFVEPRLLWESNRAKLRSINMKFFFSWGTEASMTNITMVLCRKRKGGFTEAEVAANSGSLVDGIDYVKSAVGLSGIVTMNKKRYQILKSKRFILADEPNMQKKEFSWYVNLGTVLKKRDFSHEQVASWKDMAFSDIKFHQQVFLYVFNNNSSLDLEYPRFEMSTSYNMATE